MFHKGVAVAVLVNGKVARDEGQIVRLPFNTEYSLRVKNTHNTPAAVSITIDGVDVLDGKKLRVPADMAVDLDRYLASDLQEGTRFKFIAMTERIAEHRGRKVDDGVVVVRWQYEQPVVVCTSSSTFYTPFVYYYSYPRKNNEIIYCKDSTGLSWTSSNTQGSPTCDCYIPNAVPCSAMKEGFTTRGSQSHQRFSEVEGNALEEEVYEISFRIVGEEEGKKVEQVITTKTRPVCDVCGEKNAAHALFCNQCGTSLRR